MGANLPRIHSNPDLLSAFVSDAAHVPGGHASGVAFPRDLGEVVALVSAAGQLLAVGAQSSLTGGATPRGDLVLSTRALDAIEISSNQRVRVGSGVPLAALQHALAAVDRYYPPVPTYDGAFVGGTIATNAAGAATFKYGSTRRWVEALTVVLADGSVLALERGQSAASSLVPVPTYVPPDVAKLSAGYYARPGMDLLDLFIGAEGTLGVIVDATLRTIPRPRRCTALIPCESDAQAVAVTAALRDEAARAWRGGEGLDVAAVEYMDSRALAMVPDQAFAQAPARRPASGGSLLLVQIEPPAGDDGYAEVLAGVLAASGVEDDVTLALPDDARGAARLFDLREAVPASVNSLVAAVKARVHPDVQKTAGDMVVPFGRLEDSLSLYRDVFEHYGLDYAIWGHLSDGNLHPNVLPQGLRDVQAGQEAILEIGRQVIRMGGAPLAEHGVGRSPLKQRLLREMYGENGIDEMRAVKRALDPGWKLSSGVLFPPP